MRDGGNVSPGRQARQVARRFPGGLPGRVPSHLDFRTRQTLQATLILWRLRGPLAGSDVTTEVMVRL